GGIREAVEKRKTLSARRILGNDAAGKRGRRTPRVAIRFVRSPCPLVASPFCLLLLMLTFNNRTALVTGAGRGIGKAIAETLAKHGVTVICVSKSAEACGATAAAIVAAGGKAKALAVDVANGAAIAKAVEELSKEFPAIDILVNNAGITRDGLLFRMSETDWNDVIATNLTSCFHWTK